MNIIDKVISAVSPSWGVKRTQARVNMAINQYNVQRLGPQGYGNHGASTTRKSLRSYNVRSGDAQEDIEFNIDRLRARSRDLFMGGALANGALKAIRTNVVGTGLKLKPAIDADFLNLSQEQASKLKRDIELEWSMWADSKNCDANGMHNFYELQQLAFLSWIMSGDVFTLLLDIKNKFSQYDLRIRLVEADRCDTPADKMTDVNVREGVELDANGMVTAYYFSDRHPYDVLNAAGLKYSRVEVRGALSGRRNVLHLMDAERPDQRRGVPLLAPVIEQFKQLERYSEAEIAAAVISSMFTVFIKKANEEDSPEKWGLGDEVPNISGEPLPNQTNNELKMGAGAVMFLDPGEEIQLANPTRPNSGYDPFVMAVLKQIGSSLEIPYELMLKNFTSSYSASRGALLEAWKMFKMRRSWMSADFCQPIYEEWFAEAVLSGRIDAPGYFDDPQIARAYTRAEWAGPSYGVLDPVKEVQAASLRVDNGFSTRQREAAELTGTDYAANVRELSYEQQIREQYSTSTTSSEEEVVEEEETQEQSESEEGGE